tara:strand:- start:253 stop:525 length:273 start_codon:yes stop_codon:yes gene_type:complete
MVGILKKAGKALKKAKKAQETSKFLTRRKTLAGARDLAGTKEAIPNWFRNWLKNNPVPRGTPGPKTRKKQVSDFVKRRKQMGGPKSYKLK